jgi:hypothetical protein
VDFPAFGRPTMATNPARYFFFSVLSLLSMDSSSLRSPHLSVSALMFSSRLPAR